MTDPTPKPNDLPPKFVGWVLMAIGGLMATLCGLCSLASLASMAFALISSPPSGDLSAIAGLLVSVVVIALIGGLPTVLGLFLFRIGLKTYRTAAKPSDADVFK